MQYRFIHARSSRDPLSIGKEQLLHALTHLQAMPAFLNHIFTFSRREGPHLQAAFSYEDHLAERSQTLRIDELGRSGVQTQHCFNLVGIEFEKKNDSWPWLMRQTAVHFSFDLVGGQASWIIVKANAVIREHLVKDVEANSSRRQLDDVSTIEGSFSLALRTHLLIFEWCIENWSDYIGFLENAVERPSALTKGSSVAEMTAEAVISRYEAINSPIQSRQNTGLSNRGPVSRTTSFREWFGITQKPVNNPPQTNPAEATDGNELDVEQLFPFDQLQDLHRNVDRLEDASGVINQDKKVIEDIIQRFECLKSSTVFTSHVKTDAIDFDRFYQRAHACVRELENQLTRLRTIINGLDKVISLVSI